MLSSRRCSVLAAVLALLGAGVSVPAWAQVKSSTANYIFQCTNAQGRVLTSDRLIGECNDREQTLSTKEGVMLRIIPPSLTATEREAYEARQAKERAVLEAKAEAQRRDKQLLARFSNEASHQRARDNAMDSAISANRISQTRLAALDDERKPLQQESEFYKGKALPAKLQQQFDALAMTEAAIHTAMQAQRDEMARINEMYDIELERLKKLWAGAPSGSLGPMRSVTVAPTPAPVPAATTAPAAAAVAAAKTSVSPGSGSANMGAPIVLPKRETVSGAEAATNGKTTR
jgi:hypothetical protein